MSKITISAMILASFMPAILLCYKSWSTTRWHIPVLAITISLVVFSIIAASSLLLPSMNNLQLADHLLFRVALASTILQLASVFIDHLAYSRQKQRVQPGGSEPK